MDNNIKIIGIGGGGMNILHYMHAHGIAGADLIVCNTDREALATSPISQKLLIGKELTEGLGAGSMPQIGRDAAIGSLEEIEKIFDGNVKMVFLVACLGGGTGSGATKIIAETARRRNILTIAMVTLPFSFEGKRRQRNALEAIESLTEAVDAFALLNNEQLRAENGNRLLNEAFKEADRYVYEYTKSITEIITLPGYINIDFKDIWVILKDAGLMKLANAKVAGIKRADVSVRNLFKSPFLINNGIERAKYILLNIATSPEHPASMDEIATITDYLQEEAGLTADLIWGNTENPSLGEDLSVTLVATGFDFESNLKAETEIVTHLEDVFLTRDESSLSLYFLEEEYAPEEVAKILSFLSELYRSEGGDAIVIKGKSILEFDSVLTTI
jgi:cell division protein FtsZ